jgi:hypothetical protein
MSDRNSDEFQRAVRNIVRHTKRSLLDVVDFVKSQRVPDPENDPAIHAALDMVLKRIHNDVSMVESQVMAAFAIYRGGGTIPPFGRSEEEMRASQPSPHR